jgi:putative nucleotidyltransferase with HDIG domain
MLMPKNPLADMEAVARVLPPFPKVILQILDLLRDDESSLEVLARLIRNDPVIAGNVLCLANHIRRLHAQSDLTDPYTAASLIGINRLRRIAVALGMNQFIGSGIGGNFFFNHSFAVAITSQEIGLMCDVSPMEAYVAGILHDVGQLWFHVVNVSAFSQAYQLASVDGRLLEREAEIFGADHSEIGAKLAEFWNLPQAVVEAIRLHHDDTAATGNLQAVIGLGETLARALDIPQSSKNRVLKINTPAMELLGIHWDSPEMMDCFGRCHARFLQSVRE